MKGEKNCHNCKHNHIVFGSDKKENDIVLSDNKDSCLGPMYGHCLAGNIEIFKEWYEKNKDVPISEMQETICENFEFPDIIKAMNDLIKHAENILNKKGEMCNE